MLILYMYMFFVFFKQKTAYEMRISDWSSDVCSSDLQRASAGSDRPGAMHGACGAPARDCRCATGGRRPDRTSAQPWTGRGMRRHDLRGRGKLNRETEGPRSSRKQDSARSKERRVGKGWVSPCRHRGKR